MISVLNVSVDQVDLSLAGNTTPFTAATASAPPATREGEIQMSSNP
ncbi:hypothetical protein RMSM_07012 [Rhodopirellula maiorica SM1]|uniref:Uncharacterized protein n=1 Tax=Rhodopirellula maiorica SM1 TaxID=1265738 RepID=M5RQ17_9BACT|nr:hypothetical protein RMSM_07012 [Rhodopirellula maiorica SM1]